MSWFSNFLWGTEDEAAAANEQNVKNSLGFQDSVDIPGFFNQARGALSDRGAQDFTRAISTVGTAGTGAQLGALQREREAQAGNRQQLAGRGLYNSSLATGADAGIRAGTDRTLADIQDRTAGAQAGLLAGRGQLEFRKDLATADLFAGEAGMELRRQTNKSGILGGVQHQGQSGALSAYATESTVGAANAGNNLVSNLCCFTAAAVPASAQLGPGGWAAVSAMAAASVPSAVRAYRDRCPLLVRRGYYRMAERVAPLMRYPRVHALVRGLMVEPATRHAEGSGWIDRGIVACWHLAFSALGALGPVTRSNGETV